MSANEVAEELGVSVTKAYKMIRGMNEELSRVGYYTIAGRIDRRYFQEKYNCTAESLKERLTIKSQV